MGTPLEDHLLRHGLLSADALMSAVERQRALGGTLDTALLEDRALSETRLLLALEKVAHRRSLDLRDVEPVPQMAERLPVRVVETLSVVPLSFQDGILHVACAYPVGEEPLRRLEGLLKTPIKAWVALECRVLDWRQRLYGLPVPERIAALLEGLNGRAPASGDDVLLGEAPLEINVETTQWTLDEARLQLGTAHDVSRLLEVAMHFAQQTFHYVAVFKVQDGMANFLTHKGAARHSRSLPGLRIPLDTASVFRTVAHSRGNYVGPLPADEFSHHYLEALDRKPRFIFLYPVEVRGRLLAILYGDNGKSPIRQRGLAELLLFCQELSTAFGEYLLSRREKKASTPPALPRASRKLAPSSLQLDYDWLLGLLTGPDLQKRAEALQELTLSPEASAACLASRFPGPTSWPRVVVSELPPAEELGPYPAAMTWLGRPGAAALAPLLSSDDSDARYMALLTAGNMPSPELLLGVMKSLFDLEPEIASAARAAAPSFRDLPKFEASVAKVREALDSAVPLRKTLAIKAVAALRDVESIEMLIALTSHESSHVAHGAAEALREITTASFGTHTQQWMTWWSQNQSRPRSEWLLSALRHPELEVRQRAIDELAAANHDTLGYAADGSPSDRDAAVRRWESNLREGRALS